MYVCFKTYLSQFRSFYTGYHPCQYKKEKSLIVNFSGFSMYLLKVKIFSISYI